MPLPHWVARINRRYTNRLIEPLVRASSGFATVRHTGRRSGAEYETPVNIFWLSGDAVIALTYGPGADWVQNVLAGCAAVTWDGSTHPIEQCEVVDRSIAWPALPRLVRAALRMLRVHDFLRVSIKDLNTSR